MIVCTACGKKEAKIRFTKLSHGTVEELHVCPDCAVKTSKFHASHLKETDFSQQSVNVVLATLMGLEGGGAVDEIPDSDPIAEEAINLSCGKCGLEFAKYKKTYMLGCPECYDFFGESLRHVIERIQGADEHQGEAPVAPEPVPTIDLKAQIRALKVELEGCIEAEDFANAARVRDQIKQVQNQLDSHL